MYLSNGKRRWYLTAHKKKAYMWQAGRFDKDIEFWKQRVSDPQNVGPVKQGLALRIYLSTEQDFKNLREAIQGPFQQVSWLTEEDRSEELE